MARLRAGTTEWEGSVGPRGRVELALSVISLAEWSVVVTRVLITYPQHHEHHRLKGPTSASKATSRQSRLRQTCLGRHGE